MRILIYSETEAADRRRAELRQQGHQVSLRNPEWFKVDDMDRSPNLVIADDLAIIEAYTDAGIETERLTK